MNKTNAMDFLAQYDILQKSCQIIEEQMFEIASLLRELKREENINTAERSEKVSHRADKYLAHLTGEYKNLSMRKRLLTYRIKLIESVVNALPKLERIAIERFFLSHEKHAAEDLMEELEFEKTQIYRIRTRALKMVGEIIANIPLCNDADDET